MTCLLSSLLAFMVIEAPVHCINHPKEAALAGETGLQLRCHLQPIRLLYPHLADCAHVMITLLQLVK